MPTITTSIRVEASPEAVGRVLTDLELAPEWTAGLERLEVVSGTPGQAGSVGHAHYVEGGRRYTLVDKLEATTPNRYYRSRISGGGIAATVETILAPIGDEATELTIRWVGHGTTPVTWVVVSLMRRRIAQRAHADLSSLARLAESV